MIRKSCCYTAVVVVALAATASAVAAQNLAHRSRLDLRLGTRATSRTTTSPGGVVKNTEAGEILPSIGVTHWLGDGLALTATASLLRARVDSDTPGGSWQTEKAFSVPLLVGLRRFIPSPAKTSRFRPWVSAEGGPAIGMEVTANRSRYGGGSSASKAIGVRFALAARGGVGMDAHLGDFLAVSGSAGYLLIPGFLDPGGNQNNQEGLEVGITLSLFLGQKVADGAAVREGNH